MQKLVRQIKHLVSGQDPSVPVMALNRIAQAHSHDRALAAFRADQARIAQRARRIATVEQGARV